MNERIERKLQNYGDEIELHIDGMFEVFVRRTDVGYVVDAFDDEHGIALGTIPIWDEDLED